MCSILRHPCPTTLPHAKMATSQQKKEKEQFFRELDALDQLVSDDDDEEGERQQKMTTIKVPETPVNQLMPPAAQRSANKLTSISASRPNKIEQHTRKRKSAHQDPDPASETATIPVPQIMPASVHPVFEPTTKKTKQKAQPKGDVTNMSNLKQRKRQLPRVMLQKLKPLPTEQQTFTGLVFCE